MSRSRPAIAALLVFAMSSQRSAHAYPADVFATASPVQAPASSAAPTAGDSGGHRVSDDGAAEFSIPIPDAPNRQGMTPQLALSYSSRGAVRGGVAVGWSLNVPVIERDTTRGVMGHRDFRSSLTRGRLIRVDSGAGSNQEWRAQQDPSGTRYVRVIDVAKDETLSWQAHTTDGRVYYFGETGASKDTATAATLGVPVKEGRFFVTRIVDRFGNEIEFNYEKVAGGFNGKNLSPVAVDIALTSVAYGRNTNASLPHHARLVFDYAPQLDLCPSSQVPIGAQFDYRTGYPIYKGARRLEAIRLEVTDGVFWRQRRMVDLAYDSTEFKCQLYGKLHAPLRLLTSVTESGTAPDGTVTTLPATTFEYGRIQREFSRAVLYTNTDLGHGQQALSTDKGGGWPTVDAMLLDVDGDALPDRLRSRRGESGRDAYYCEARWDRNLGTPTFATPAELGTSVADRPANQRYLPVMPWAGALRADVWADGGWGQYEGIEDCSLSAQFSRESDRTVCGYAANYMSYRFMDLTGDGLPDLVTGIDSNRGRYKPEKDARLWPATASCGDALTCQCTDEGACRDANGEEQLCTIIDAPNALLFDQTQDPDTSGSPCEDFCCTPEEAGRISNGSAEPIQRAGAVEGGTTFDFSQFYAYVRRNWQPMQVLKQESTGEHGSAIWRGGTACQMYPEHRCGSYVLRVYDNLGDGRFATTPRVVSAPIPVETDRATSRLGAGHLAVSGSWHGFLDIDGDSRMDAVYKEPDWANIAGAVVPHLQVFRGNGMGEFAAEGTLWPTDAMTAAPRIRVGGNRALTYDFPPATDMWERPANTAGVTASFTSGWRQLLFPLDDNYISPTSMVEG